MPKCSALFCSTRTESGTKVHRFPRDPVRRAVWIKNCHRPNWTPNDYSVLCDMHFEDSQYENNRADGWRRLKPFAIPTLFNESDISARRRQRSSVGIGMKTDQEVVPDCSSEMPGQVDDRADVVPAELMAGKSVKNLPPVLSGLSEAERVFLVNNSTFDSNLRSTGPVFIADHSYSRPLANRSPASASSFSVEPSSVISAGHEELPKTNVTTKSTVDVRKNLLLLQRQGYMCDTCLVCEDGVIRVHGVVWSAASATMHSALSLQGAQLEHVLVFPGVMVSLMKIAVQFAYTGDIVLTQQYSSDAGLCTVLQILNELGLISGIPQLLRTANDVVESHAAVDLPTITPTIVQGHGANVKAASTEFDLSLDPVVSVVSGGTATDDVCCSVVPATVTDKNSAQQPTVTATEPAAKRSNKRKSKKLPQGPVLSNDEQNSSSPAEKRNETGVVCDLCGLVCAGAGGFVQHRKSHFFRPPEHRCSQCGLKCSTNATLKRHMKLHTGERPFLCQFCGNSYITKDAMLSHMSTHSSDLPAKHGVNFAPFLCRKCGERFATSAKRTYHNKFTCKERLTPPVISARTIRRNIFRLGKLAGNTKQSSKSLSYVDLKFPCSECNEKFLSQLALAIHKRKHTRGVALHCVLCNEEYMKIRDLHRHLNSVHDVKTPFVCKFCNADFVSYQAMYLHRRQYHTSRHSLSCDECGKVCQSRQLLEDHKRLHTGSKPFYCGTCDTDLRTLRELQHHRLMHSAKRQHSCETCGKSFHTERSLTFHRYIHAEEKPFKCSECGRTFSSCSHLKRHLLTHSGAKPYTCSDCTKAYKCRHDLRIHMKNVHEIELPVLCSRVKVGNEQEVA